MATTETASDVDATRETPKTCSPLFRRNMTPDKQTSTFLYCRICHEDGSAEELIDPCKCTGTLGSIHTTCLEKWLSTSNTDRCEICKYTFAVQKRNKPLPQSFRQWWTSRNIHGPQGIMGDVICFVVLTPLCFAATYLCGVGASAYTSLGFWEGTGLAILCCMLVATYCLWLILTIRYHFKSWKHWCRRNQDVRLVIRYESEESSSHETRIKTYWTLNQDSNNNRTNYRNRLISWLFSSFSNDQNTPYTL